MLMFNFGPIQQVWVTRWLESDAMVCKVYRKQDLQSPHWIPSFGKLSSSVVAAQHVRIDPNICGMKPSRVYVNAHQHVAVIAIIRMVESHTE